MSLMQCRSCPARFTVGLLRCPHCQTVSELFAQPGGGGEAMPKITVAGGPSNAAADVGAVTPEAHAPEVEVEAAAPEPDESPAEVETKAESAPDVSADPVSDKPAAAPAAARKSAAKKAVVSKP